jgi:hypothetical protein
MALDLARIAHYADATGTMWDEPRRRHLSFIDGIVAGEGEGPLSPRAVDAGVIAFSDNVAWGDHVAARLMGFEPDTIPIVRESRREARWGLVPLPAVAPDVVLNGQRCALDAVRPAVGRPFEAPRGWRGTL